MPEDEYDIFTFSCGGFCNDWHEFRIEKRDGVFTVMLEDKRASGPIYTRKLTKTQLGDFERSLDAIGIPGWFCHYDNWHVLDGTQWEMTYHGDEYSGSNAFPEGFTKLMRYLADEFDCECFRGHEGSEKELGAGPDPIGHIAAYASRLPARPEDEDEAKEIDAECRKLHREMLRDLDALVRAEPRFVNYMKLVEKGGVPMGAEAARECNVSSFDADTIAAMLIYIYREDRFCGYQEHFLEYLKDGTIRRWLNRLEELVDCPFRGPRNG